MRTLCSSCGGDVPVERDSLVVECPFCASRLIVDLGRVHLHYRMEPVLDEKRAREAVSAELARRELTEPHAALGVQLEYLPYWRVDSAAGAKLRPAAALPPGRLSAPPIPAGELVFFEASSAGKARIVYPDQHWTAEPDGGAGGKPSLLHLPFHRLTYLYAGKRFEASVDAVSGRVLADEWPPAVERRGDTALFALLAAGGSAFLLEGYCLASGWAAVFAILLTLLPLAFAAHRLLEKP